jgi:acyl carrier protein
MERAAVVRLVTASLNDVFKELDIVPPGEVDETTPLLGRGALLDSLGLVTVIVDIEQRLAEQHGVAISLADERAMSERHSPFRSVGALADYIGVLLQEQRDGI